jgi:hypothetical protein
MSEDEHFQKEYDAIGHFHDTRNISNTTLGDSLWTRMEYFHDSFPNFQCGISDKNHTLNPRGITYGEVFRFGPSGSQF